MKYDNKYFLPYLNMKFYLYWIYCKPIVNYNKFLYTLFTFLPHIFSTCIPKNQKWEKCEHAKQDIKLLLLLLFLDYYYYYYYHYYYYYYYLSLLFLLSYFFLISS